MLRISEPSTLLPQSKSQSSVSPTHFCDASLPLSSLISIRSTPRIIPAKQDADCQAEMTSFSEQSTQAPIVSEIEIQTDVSSFEGYSYASRGRVTMNEVIESQQRLKLESFLGKVESLVSQQLLQNLQSTAFQGYVVNWEDEIDSITCVHPISHREREPDHVCTDLSWSKTGSTVAITYGRFDHQSLCFHKGLLCIWSLRSRDFNPESASFTATASSCLMTCAFHPEIPSLIAAGAANGDIMVWSTLSQDNTLIASTTTGDVSHQESICKLVWVPDQRHQKYNLLSAASDGKLIIWSVENGSLTPISMTRLAVAHLPSSLKQSGVKSNVPLGIMSMTLCPDNKTEVIVGTETGYVFRLNLSSFTAVESKRKPGSESLSKSLFGTDNSGDVLPSPVLFTYTGHAGPVQCISYNFSHRHLFLTSGSDGYVRLYHALQAKPLLVWEPSPNHAVSSVCWSPFRPTVFLAVCSSGMLFIYDLARSTTTSSITMSCTSKPGISSTLASFNPVVSDWMTTGDSEGILRLWKVSTHFQTGDIARDMQMLQQLGSLETVFSSTKGDVL